MALLERELDSQGCVGERTVTRVRGSPGPTQRSAVSPVTGRTERKEGAARRDLVQNLKTGDNF